MAALAAAVGFLFWKAEHQTSGAYTAPEMEIEQPVASSTRSSDSESSDLRLGLPAADRNQVTIPLEFHDDSKEPVGAVEARLSVSDPQWKFLKATAPERSHLHVSAKQVSESSGSSADKSLIELDISAHPARMKEGTVGYLTFSVNDPTSLPKTPVSISKVDIYPPEPEAKDNQPESAGELPATPDEVTPSPGCFFFTH